MLDREGEWPIAPTRPWLTPGEVHVWRVPLVQDVQVGERLSAILSSEERQRAGRFRFPWLQTRFVLTRAVTRSVLAGYLDVSPAEIMFAYEEHGKPVVARPRQDLALHFNLSHSHELALLAVSLGRRVGVDVERLRPIPDAERIARRFFSHREYDGLRLVPEQMRQEAFLRCWTRKEAFAKARGEGLALLFRRFEVTQAQDGSPRLCWIEWDPEEPRRWELVDLHPRSGYLASLAVEGGLAGLACWTWNGASR